MLQLKRLTGISVERISNIFLQNHNLKDSTINRCYYYRLLSIFSLQCTYITIKYQTMPKGLIFSRMAFYKSFEILSKHFSLKISSIILIDHFVFTKILMWNFHNVWRPLRTQTQSTMKKMRFS